MSDTEEPRWPITELQAEAIQLHSMLVIYLEVGFTRAEAFKIVLAAFKEGMIISQEEADDDDV